MGPWRRVWCGAGALLAAAPAAALHAPVLELGAPLAVLRQLAESGTPEVAAEFAGAGAPELVFFLAEAPAAEAPCPAPGACDAVAPAEASGLFEPALPPLQPETDYLALLDEREPPSVSASAAPRPRALPDAARAGQLAAGLVALAALARRTRAPARAD